MLAGVRRSAGVPRARPRLASAAAGCAASAYSSDTLEADLRKVAAECVTRQECASIDASGQVLAVTPVFSWREAEFVKAFGDDAMPAYPGRSPLERAILHVLAPHFLPRERRRWRRTISPSASRRTTGA